MTVLIKILWITEWFFCSLLLVWFLHLFTFQTIYQEQSILLTGKIEISVLIFYVTYPNGTGLKRTQEWNSEDTRLIINQLLCNWVDLSKSFDICNNIITCQ